MLLAEAVSTGLNTSKSHLCTSPQWHCLPLSWRYALQATACCFQHYSFTETALLCLGTLPRHSEIT